MPLIKPRKIKLREIQWLIEPKEILNETNVIKTFQIMLKALEKSSWITRFLNRIRSTFTFLQEAPKYIALLGPTPTEGKVGIDMDTVLGEGSFGTVNLGTFQFREGQGLWSELLTAVKIIDHAKDRCPLDTVTMVAQEVMAMTKCRHPNIIGLLFVVIYRDQTLLGMQFASRGTLRDYLGYVIDCRTWYKNIAEAIHYCHMKGVLHLDIKPENILVDEFYNVKVADFGLCKIVADPPNYPLTEECYFIDDKRRGTLPYMAPEMFYGDMRDGRKCDVWSLGVLLYEMLIPHHYPFDIRDMENIKDQMKDEVQYIREVYDVTKTQFPEYFPEGAEEIVRAIFIFDPVQRPGIPEIFSHPWLHERYIMEPAETPNVALSNPESTHGHQEQYTGSGHEGIADRPLMRDAAVQCKIQKKRKTRRKRRGHRPLEKGSTTQQILDGVKHVLLDFSRLTCNTVRKVGNYFTF